MPGELEEVSQALEGAIARVFPKLDRVAFGAALGAAAGVLVFLATIALVIRGGDVVGPNLQLLSAYFPGYSVTVPGSLLGLMYGFFSGFVGGWSFAFVRNGAMLLTMSLIHRRAEWKLTEDLFRYF
jgi:hypothetical protein